MPDSIPFTAEERYLISYYRATTVSKWTRHLAVDGAFFIASLLFVVLFLKNNDTTAGLVGYAILFFRLIAGLLRGRRTIPAFQSIIAKYEARIAALEKRSE